MTIENLLLINLIFVASVGFYLTYTHNVISAVILSNFNDIISMVEKKIEIRCDIHQLGSPSIIKSDEHLSAEIILHFNENYDSSWQYKQLIDSPQYFDWTREFKADEIQLLAKSFEKNDSATIIIFSIKRFDWRRLKLVYDLNYRVFFRSARLNILRDEKIASVRNKISSNSSLKKVKKVVKSFASWRCEKIEMDTSENIVERIFSRLDELDIEADKILYAVYAEKRCDEKCM